MQYVGYIGNFYNSFENTSSSTEKFQKAFEFVIQNNLIKRGISKIFFQYVGTRISTKFCKIDQNEKFPDTYTDYNLNFKQQLLLV